jgi:hypothetical protein
VKFIVEAEFFLANFLAQLRGWKVRREPISLATITPLFFLWRRVLVIHRGGLVTGRGAVFMSSPLECGSSQVLTFVITADVSLFS